MASLPKKLQDIFNKKEDYLNTQRNKLESSVLMMQERLLNEIISDIVSELDTNNGQIKQTTKNIRLISQLEDTYAAFNTSIQVPVVQQLGKGLIGLNDFNKSYFTALDLDGVSKKRFDSVINNTNEFMKAKIGVTPKGTIDTGSFLDSFLTDRSLINDVKQITTRAVTGGMPLSDYKQLLKYKVTGSKEMTGGFERYYQQFAYDEYNRYDSTYANMVATEFNLKYAWYTGSLIETSREFCEKHTGKVYTKEEVDAWSKWRDSTGNIPSYLKMPGYNPVIDRGGYRCRHSIVWVDKITAYRMRPELKDM